MLQGPQDDVTAKTDSEVPVGEYGIAAPVAHNSQS